MKLSLVRKDQMIDNIWSFVFEPEHALEYEAGQYVRVLLDHPNPDDEGPKRFFTNSAPPYAGVVQITTRLTGSTFKQALANLQPGSEALEMTKPHEGDFVWRDTDRPTLYVAGGIGVTPFHSILKERAHQKNSIPVSLFYNGRTDALPWKDDFAAIAAEHPEFSVSYLIGEILTAEAMLTRYPRLNDSLVYLSGPEPMVENIGNALKEGGLAEDQLVQDWFPNYHADNY